MLIFWGKATLYKCTKEKSRVDCNGKKSQNTWNHSSVGVWGNLVNILYRQIFASKKGPPGGCRWSAVSQWLKIPLNVSFLNLPNLSILNFFFLNTFNFRAENPIQNGLWRIFRFFLCVEIFSVEVLFFLNRDCSSSFLFVCHRSRESAVCCYTFTHVTPARVKVRS